MSIVVPRHFVIEGAQFGDYGRAQEWLRQEPRRGAGAEIKRQPHLSDHGERAIAPPRKLHPDAHPLLCERGHA